MEFVVPIHPEDLELRKNDRFCVDTVVEIEDGATDVDGMLDGERSVARAGAAPEFGEGAVPPTIRARLRDGPGGARARPYRMLAAREPDWSREVLTCGCEHSLPLHHHAELTERLMDDNGRIQETILSHDVFDKLYSLVKCVCGWRPGKGWSGGQV